MNIAILATDGFEQSELTSPRDYFNKKGDTVHIIAPDGASTIKAWDKTDWGITVEVDKTLSEVDASEYDALVLPGGQMNPDSLRANADAVDFIRSFGESGKPVAAICHAPWLLIEAGLVKGKTLTSYKSIRTDLRNAGANVVDQEVAEDGNLITSRNPDDLPAFNRALANALRRSAVPA